MQYVIFCVGSEEFAIDIRKVREIIRLREATRIPQTPSFIQGVINLRGDVIPIIDLRKRFGLDKVEITNETRTIIIEMEGYLIGLIVDSVTEVLKMDGDNVELPHNNVAGLKSDYIAGIGKMDDRLLIILKVEMLLSSEEKLKLELKAG